MKERYYSVQKGVVQHNGVLSYMTSDLLCSAHLLPQLDESRSRLDCIHTQVVGHNVVGRTLQLEVAHVVLGKLDGGDVVWVLVVVGGLPLVQLRPLHVTAVISVDVCQQVNKAFETSSNVSMMCQTWYNIPHDKCAFVLNFNSLQITVMKHQLLNF